MKELAQEFRSARLSPPCLVLCHASVNLKLLEAHGVSPLNTSVTTRRAWRDERIGAGVPICKALSAVPSTVPRVRQSQAFGSAWGVTPEYLSDHQAGLA